MSEPLVLDLFAGAGGWSEGARLLGVRAIGMELDPWACATRAKAGHLTIRADVATYPVDVIGCAWGLIASPPCQTFSQAGGGDGIRDLAKLHHAIEACRDGWKAPANDWADPRTPLVLEVLRWAWHLKPEWIACEQVPPCLPLWEHMAYVLVAWGYDAMALKLSAERYGVPQTRQRAFLLAHRGGVRLAAPTHQRYERGVAQGEGDDCRDSLLGPGLKAWVSMAEALGWEPGSRAWDRRVGGYAEGAAAIADTEPAPTVTPSHQRDCWRVRTGTNSMKHGRRVEDMVPYERPISHPSPTVDVKAGSAWRLRMGNQAGATEREAGEPSPTILFGNRVNEVEWVHQRPAKTVHGTFAGDVQTRPGRHEEKLAAIRDAGSVKITLEEAAVLQSFRRDYPFQGPKSARFRQVGNAMPPRWARALLGELVARDEVRGVA